MLQALNRWQQDSRITITGTGTHLKQGNADDFANVECKVDGSGSLPVLTRFLYEVERDPLGLKVDLVELSSLDDRGSQLSLGLTVSGLELNPPPLP